MGTESTGSQRLVGLVGARPMCVLRLIRLHLVVYLFEQLDEVFQVGGFIPLPDFPLEAEELANRRLQMLVSSVILRRLHRREKLAR